MYQISDVEACMTAAFLDNAALTAKIGRRFYKVACKEWIATYETTSQERIRLAPWIDYSRSGQVIRALKSSAYESNSAWATFNIRCWGYVMEDAETVLDTLMDVIGTGYSGTWSANGNTISIKKAHWIYENMLSDFDETFKQAWASVGLAVRYIRT